MVTEQEKALSIIFNTLSSLNDVDTWAYVKNQIASELSQKNIRLRTSQIDLYVGYIFAEMKQQDIPINVSFSYKEQSPSSVNLRQEIKRIVSFKMKEEKQDKQDNLGITTDFNNNRDLQQKGIPFTVGEQYTRAQIGEIIRPENPPRGGDWTTGYCRIDDKLFIFMNIGVPGRTGHDFENRFFEETRKIEWFSKPNKHSSNPLFQKIIFNEIKLLFFGRWNQNHSLFTFLGEGVVDKYLDNYITPQEHKCIKLWVNLLENTNKYTLQANAKIETNLKELDAQKEVKATSDTKSDTEKDSIQVILKDFIQIRQLISNLDMPNKLKNSLISLNVVYLGDIFSITKRQFLREQSVGEKAWAYLNEFLKQQGIERKNDHEWAYVLKAGENNIISTIFSTYDVQRLMRSQNDISYPEIKQRGHTKGFNPEEFTSKSLEILFTPLDKVSFSYRTLNVFNDQGFTLVGEIFTISEDKLIRLQNFGRNSLDEVKDFQKKHGLEGLNFSDWPDKQKIDEIISERNLSPGDYFDIIIDEGEFLEDEIYSFFRSKLSEKECNILLNRIGLNKDALPLTLEEISSDETIFESRVTRERVRQIEAKALKKLKQNNFSLPHLEPALNKVTSVLPKNFSGVDEVLIESGLMNSKSPTQLLIALQDLNLFDPFMEIFSIDVIDTTLLLNKELEWHSELKKFLTDIRREFVGKLFVSLDTEKFSKYEHLSPEHVSDVLSQIEAFHLQKDGSLIRVFMRFDDLDRSISKFQAPMARIFQVTNGVYLATLLAALNKFRTLIEFNVKDTLPQEALKDFLSSLDFITIKDDFVYSSIKPIKSALDTYDVAILKTLKSFGTTIDSTTLQKEVVKQGFSSAQAGQARLWSPFLVVLKKGRSREKGLYEFIGKEHELNKINFSIKYNSNLTQLNPIIIVPNNSITRLRNYHVIESNMLPNGKYEVTSCDGVFIGNIIIQDNQMKDIRDILRTTDKEQIKLSIKPDSTTFIMGDVTEENESFSYKQLGSEEQRQILMAEQNGLKASEPLKHISRKSPSNTSTSQIWSEDRVKKLKELKEEGYSADKIAKALGGTTRNAVIGKINRLKETGFFD